MSTIATLLARLELDTSGFQKGIASIPGTLNSVGSSISQVGGSLTRGVTLPVLAAGAATVALAGQAIKTGADFEKAMSGVGAILGSTKDEIEQLSDTALDLGMSPDLVITASEAASIMEELAKNGLTAQEIMGGAAEGAIALANATGTDFASAAQIASTAMKLFNIDAEDMEDVVNQVTGVANSSRFTAEDFAQAIGMGGAAAASNGVPFEEFTAAITALSTVTNSGSDAGTSFKTMLTRLSPVTDKATEMMQDLGIITEEAGNRFYDSEGNLKSLSEVAGILDETLSGLSELDRSNALEVMFGSDASRAAIGLMQTGQQGFKDLMATMAETDAAANAATRMDNLSGSFEILGGIIEAFQIKFEKAVGPGIRTAIESFSKFLSDNSKQVDSFFAALGVAFTNFGNSLGPWLEKNGPAMMLFFQKVIETLPEFIAKMSEIGTVVAPKIEQLFNAFMNADPNTIVSIMEAIGTLAVLGPVLSAIGGFIVTISSVITLVGSAWTAVSGIVSFLGTAAATVGGLITGGILLPILVIIGTLALLWYAFDSNFMGITTTAQQLGFIIGAIFKNLGSEISIAWTNFWNIITTKFNEMKTTVMQLDTIFRTVSLGIQRAIMSVIQKVIQLAATLLKIKLPPALTPGSPTPFENGLRGIASAMQLVNDTGLPVLDEVNSPAMPTMNSAGISSSGSGDNSSKSVVVNITNPKKEAAEDSIRKTLKNLNYLGVIE